jgi:hypothetical protein
MRDQAQVELHCRADPFLLRVRASRIIHGAPLQFRDVFTGTEDNASFSGHSLKKWDEVVKLKPVFL